MKSPVFIVGCPRSGTTLLRMMLASHSALAIPPESHFIKSCYPGKDYADQAVITKLLSHPRFSHFGVRVNLEEGDYSNVIGEIFEAYARAKGKKYWGDKTPSYVLEIPLLSQLFPDAKFIDITRDGRDCILSFHDVDLKKGLRRRNIHFYSRFWRKRILAAMNSSAFHVKYEDLVKDPELHLRKICEHLELPFEEQMVKALGDANLPEAEIHGNIYKSVSTNRTHRWKKQMSAYDKKVFQRINGDLLRKLGYDSYGPQLNGIELIRYSLGELMHLAESQSSSKKLKALWRRARRSV